MHPENKLNKNYETPNLLVTLIYDRYSAGFSSQRYSENKTYVAITHKKSGVIWVDSLSTRHKGDEGIRYLEKPLEDADELEFLAAVPSMIDCATHPKKLSGAHVIGGYLARSGLKDGLDSPREMYDYCLANMFSNIDVSRISQSLKDDGDRYHKLMSNEKSWSPFVIGWIKNPDIKGFVREHVDWSLSKKDFGNLAQGDYKNHAVDFIMNNPNSIDFLPRLSAEGIRNSLQVINLVDGHYPSFSRLIESPVIHDAIINGNSISEALKKSINLSDYSKKSIQNFFHNVVVETKCKNIDPLDPDASVTPDLDVIGKGGFIPLERRSQIDISHFSMDKEIYQQGGLASLLTSIPVHYISEYGSDGGNKKLSFDRFIQLSSVDPVMRSLHRSIRLNREDGVSFKKTLTWMHKYLSGDVKIPSGADLEDGYNILADSLMKSILLYANQHNNQPRRNWKYSDENKSFPRRMMNFHSNNENFNQILSFSDAAHKYYYRLSSEGQPSSDFRWAASIDKPYGNGDLVVVPLHSVKSIHEEGRSLSHCVGTYVNRAMRSECYLFSVRNRNDIDVPLSTVEIQTFDSTLTDVEIVQHNAINNSTPTHEEVSLVRDFVHDIVKGNVGFNLETNADEAEWLRLPALQRHELECGINASNPSVVLKVMDVVDEMIPGLSEWNYRECPEIAEYLEASESAREYIKSCSNVAQVSHRSQEMST